MASPLDILTVMETSLTNYLKERIEEYPIASSEDWQVVLRSDDHPVKIRDIKSHLVSKLFVISGIIISTTKPYIKASKLRIQCRNCGNTRNIELQPGQWPFVPSTCPGQ